MAANNRTFNISQAMLETEDKANVKAAEIMSLMSISQTPEIKRQQLINQGELKRLQAQLKDLRAQAGQPAAALKRPGSGIPHRIRDKPAEAAKPAMLGGENPPATTRVPYSSSSHHRKRSIASSNVDPASGRPDSKARKPGPIEWDKAAPANDDSFDDTELLDFIDLTGEDVETDWNTRLRNQREEEQRLTARKQREAADAAFARSLAGLPAEPSGPSSSQGSSSQSRLQNNAFDRMRGRSQGYAHQGVGSAQNLSQRPQPQPWESRAPSAVPIQAGYNSNSGLANIPYHNGTPSVDGFNLDFHMPGSFPTFDQPGFGSANASSSRFPDPHALQSSAPSHALGMVKQPNGLGIVNNGRNPFSHPLSSQITPQQHLLNQNRTSSLFVNGPGPVWMHSPTQPPIQSSSSLSAAFRNGTLEDLLDEDGFPLPQNVANYLEDVMSDPRKTKEEIGELLSNIRPDMDIPIEERGETPEALRYPLYPHQILALDWMSKMETGSNKGGILADDMGLGKTISTLALIVSRKSSDPSYKTNLIIGPVALVQQWRSELEKKLKAKPHNLSVFLMHQKKPTWPQIKMFDVVLTTYGSLGAEIKRYEKHVEQRQTSAGYDAFHDEELHRLCPILHPKSKFHRVILDEAQCIKNYATLASNAASRINATYRWCLTGTPMMNGAQELGPLIRFLHIKPYSDKKVFDKAFGSLFSTKSQKRYSDMQKERSMDRLRVLLKAIMLRRTKSSEIDGKPILTLPPKTEIQDHVVFSADEHGFYKAVEAGSVAAFQKFRRAGTIGKNYTAVLTLLLRMRQACCHPHLLDFEVLERVPEDKMIELAESLAPAVVNRIKEAEAFECPICYDAVEDPTIIIPCGHDTCSECFASLSENAAQDRIMHGNAEDNRGSTAKCPQCRIEVRTDSVVNYRTFQQVHMPDKVPQNAKHLDDLDSGSDSDSDSDSDDSGDKDETDARGNLRGFVVNDDTDDSFNDEGDTDDSLFVKKDQKGKKVAEKKEKKQKKRVAEARRGKKKAEKVHVSQLGEIRKAAVRNKKARSQYMGYLRKEWKDSAKVSKVVELLSEFQATKEKTIVFSQWTTLLDLIEVHIDDKLGLRQCRYTGAMSPKQRNDSVQEFMNNEACTVMLVSLKAGNAGLNLVAASRIIICDPFWNPYIEMQAIDRAHRIGQQRPVTVHRILIQETIEDRIIQMQDEKRAIIDAAMDETKGKALARLGVQELRFLFNDTGA